MVNVKELSEHVFFNVMKLKRGTHADMVPIHKNKLITLWGPKIQHKCAIRPNQCQTQRITKTQK